MSAAGGVAAGMIDGFVLHRRRYRESSLIVEVLTRDIGRLAAVARGALRAKSRLGANLQPLSPLRLEVRGRGALKTLVSAEPAGAPRVAQGRRLYAALYVNELVMRLTAAHDPMPDLYAGYARTIAALARDEALEPLLRNFELQLLETLGIGLLLTEVAGSGDSVTADRHYDYYIEHGPVPVSNMRDGLRVSGAALLALAGRRDYDPASSRDAKRLMRHVINHYLEGRPLASRELFSSVSGAGGSDQVETDRRLNRS